MTIKIHADRILSQANSKAQNIKKSKAAKILKDFADAHRTAANAKKTKVSEGQDVTTANLESQELVEVQQKLDEVEKQLTTLTESIEEKEQEIATLTNTNTAKDQEIKELNSTHEYKVQGLQDKYGKTVEQLNKGFKEKEQAFAEEKKKIKTDLYKLVQANKMLEIDLKISKHNLSTLNNSYKPSMQVIAQQKKDEKRIQELEKQITYLKQNHSNELAKYQQENQSLKSQVAETKQANDAALKQNMCELAQQELVGTQQTMEKLKQLPPNPKPIDGAVEDNGSKRSRTRYRYSNSSLNSNDLTRSPDLLDQKVAVTNLLVKQQGNKSPVVIQKGESPTEVASSVKTRASNLLIEQGQNGLREQNSPQLAASKRSTTKVIDPATVIQGVTKPAIRIPAVISPNNAKPQTILHLKTPRQIGVQRRTKNIRD